MGKGSRMSVHRGGGVCIVSRCAWTFHNFRLGLAKSVAGLPGISVVAAGVDIPSYAEKIEKEGIRFVKLRGRVHGTHPLALFAFFVDLYRLYRSLRPNVVHHFTIRPVVFGTLAARLARVPRIVNTIAGLGRAFDEGHWLTTLYAKTLFHFSLRFSHHVFFQNEEDRELFVRNGLVEKGRTSVIPGSGVDTERFRPEAVQGKWTDQPERVVVLMASRVLRTKGVEEFVEAARLVRNRQPNALFVLLGGLDFENPAAIAEHELNEWVAAGAITWIKHQDDVRPLLARADIVVLPSYYREGVPRSLLEAASMGKPIVTTDNTGCREVVDPNVNGLIVPPRDAGALAKAINYLLQDPALRMQMGNAGRRKMIERFDERHVISQTIKAYGL
jgi:glycosyltransferase involved in cell wall biosynthesis